MGLFSKIFGGKKAVTSAAKNTSFLGNYRLSSGRSYGGGGWGLDRFNSIVDAHSSVEELVEEFALDSEGSEYMSLDGYPNCYEQAYDEEYERASLLAEGLFMGGLEIPAEDLMDMERVEQNAYNYACELVDAWLSGQEWIPEEIMDYAWYTLSDHNG